MIQPANSVFTNAETVWDTGGALLFLGCKKKTVCAVLLGATCVPLAASEVIEALLGLAGSPLSYM